MSREYLKVKTEITEEELGLCAEADTEAGENSATSSKPKFLNPIPPAESPPWELLLGEQAEVDDGPGGITRSLLRG